MRQPGHEHHRAQERAGWVIMLCLGVIAGGVFVRQYSFNPAVLVAREVATRPLLAAGLTNQLRPDWLPSELVEMGPPERFNPENLYEKIDGKAELYLSAGFAELYCQRFTLRNAPERWCEWFAYGMTAVPQAFSVFTVQRRAEAQSLELAEFACRAGNALYFLSGTNYVEFVASEANDELMSAMLNAASRYLAANPVAKTQLPQLRWLPVENQVAGTYTLQSADVFGFDQFRDVFTAQYRLEGGELTAFVTTCSNAAAAARLSASYRAFLLANGGTELSAQHAEGIGEPIQIMGSSELVFASGPFVAGVHAAPAPAPAIRAAAALLRHLQSIGK